MLGFHSEIMWKKRWRSCCDSTELRQSAAFLHSCETFSSRAVLNQNLTSHPHSRPPSTREASLLLFKGPKQEFQVTLYCRMFFFISVLRKSRFRSVHPVTASVCHLSSLYVPSNQILHPFPAGFCIEQRKGYTTQDRCWSTFFIIFPLCSFTI